MLGQLRIVIVCLVTIYCNNWTITPGQRCEIQPFYLKKRYQLIHWMEHWNKPPWHCKLPLKRTLVNFQEKKNWFDQKGIDVKEHRKGVYLHHDKKCPMTLKNKACCRPSCSKCLKKLHKTCWGTSLECRISFLSKDNHLKIKKKKKKGTTVGDEFTPSI